MNGWTGTANLRERKREQKRYFLRKLRSSYGILTDERNSYVLLHRKRLNGTETWTWKPGVFLAVSKQFTNYITTSFCQERIQIRLTFAVAHFSMFIVCLFFIDCYTVQSLSPSGPKISVTGWHLCHPVVMLKDALLYTGWPKKSKPLSGITIKSY